MNDNYKNIRELFGLTEPDGLPEEQIEKIRNAFGAIPEALEAYYRLCGGCEEMNGIQDFLVTPDGRYGGCYLEKFHYPEYCVFYVENQCVSEWAVKKADLNQENPPVYETYDDGKTWYQTCNSVSEFLISMAYMQGAFSFAYSSEGFCEADTAQVTEIMQKFPHAEERITSSIHQEISFFLPYPDTVIVVMYEMDDDFYLLYSSRSEQHFEETDNTICKILGFDSDG